MPQWKTQSVTLALSGSKDQANGFFQGAAFLQWDLLSQRETGPTSGSQTSSIESSNLFDGQY